MSDFWPQAEQHTTHEHDLAFAPVWREASKIVVSRTVEKAGWNTRVISENVVEELTALKESGATLLLFGGSVLASHLTEHGVIDEYQVFVHPVILGGGKPLFQEQNHRVGLDGFPPGRTAFRPGGGPGPPGLRTNWALDCTFLRA